MTEIIVGLVILYILVCWSLRLLILEVIKLTAENQELRASNKELLEVNYKLTKKNE